MKVSVIVPCFNVSSFVQKTVESFSKQTFSDFEVVFVNDCSTDQTKEKLGELIDQYNINGRIIDNTQNCGPSLSRLHGIQASTAEYISFCDSDDWYDSDYLKTMVSHIENNRKDIVFCNYSLAYDSGKIKKRIVLESFNKTIKDKREFLTIDIDGLCCGIYKRELFNDIVFPNLRNGEDMALIPALIERATDIGIVDDCLYFYYQREGSLSTTPTLRMINDLLLSYGYVCDNLLKPDNIYEIEYIGIRNVLYGVILNLGKIKGSEKKIKSVISSFKNDHPNWERNKYIEQLPTYKKVFLFFVKKERILMLKLLSKIHTVLSR